MGKTDLGDKQICPSCGAKFYDLRRRPAVCPKCTTSFDPSEEGVRVRRGRSRVSADVGYEDEEELEDAKAKSGDDDEDEEQEATPEIDSDAEADPILADDDEGVGPAAGDELPEGFSEEEADLGDDNADDDSVPLIEDEEEFPEDEIGDLPGDGDDDDGGR
ncbi:MAG: TIGR02300 family protein [Hyphomonadaceae bacterium]|nr:TIGR02300 family protein [Hyphomonadaceae bacterium]